MMTGRCGWVCWECGQGVLLEEGEVLSDFTEDCPECGDPICLECAAREDGCSCWMAEPGALFDPLTFVTPTKGEHG